MEVVVSSAILVFLMSAVWTSSSVRGSDFSVMVNREKLRLLAARAKSLTVNSVFEEGGNTCGYGIRTEERQAFIFLDSGACGSGNNKKYDAGERVAGSANEVILREGVKFEPSSGSVAEVVFIPPNPSVAINGSESTKEISISVIIPNGRSRSVIINNQGLISLKN